MIFMSFRIQKVNKHLENHNFIFRYFGIRNLIVTPESAISRIFILLISVEEVTRFMFITYEASFKNFLLKLSQNESYIIFNSLKFGLNILFASFHKQL